MNSRELNDISNKITDMVLNGAPRNDLEEAVVESMGLINSLKERRVMGHREFITLCTKEVRAYAKEHIDISDGVPDFEVYVVWYCKTLQNHKALLSTTLPDGMYYECTYNGDKQELYLDAYKKFENRCVHLG